MKVHEKARRGNSNCHQNCHQNQRQTSGQQAQQLGRVDHGTLRKFPEMLALMFMWDPSTTRVVRFANFGLRSTSGPESPETTP